MHSRKRSACEDVATSAEWDSARPIREVSNMARVHSAAGFVTILAACLAGAFHMSAWFICAAAAALVLVSLRQHHVYYGHYASQGSVSAQSMLLLGSTLNGATAATVAFALGHAVGWVWGY
jgi:hypothetical protein